ncbi:DUF4132 domain-containing protein [Paenibacillus bovis]|uniref:DUF4132 domain-containing protein n=1 Tax=Paenibacillus bovis TaxID=1616788 RepID=A0A172ZLP9_9BACL|nr:hypothetical protein AR543_01175 [Paenibacillus bovis]
MNERYNQHLSRIESLAASVPEPLRELADSCAKLCASRYIHNQQEEIARMVQCLNDLSQDNSQEALYEPLAGVLAILTDERTADIFRYITAHTAEYPYSTGYNRRPYRTRDITLHTQRILGKMNSLIAMHGFDFDLMTMLTERNYELLGDYRFNQDALSDLIAYELDQDNTLVMQALHDIIYGDNQTALLSYDIILGILMSHRTEAYRMISELLVAARLQEGLRQSIAETLDQGTLEASMMLIDTILQHELIRYSSIVRALGTWIGIPLESANARVTRQLIHQAYEALADSSLRREWLTDENANKVLISLWATAVHEEQELYDRIQYLMDTGVRYQKIIALYVLSNSQNKELRLRIARPHLQEQDGELLYWVLDNYAYECEYTWDFVSSVTESERVLRAPRTPLLEEKADRVHDFNRIRDIYLGLSEREIRFASSVLDDITIQYSSDRLIHKLIYLAAYDMDAQLIGEILQLKDRMSADLRGTLLDYVIKDGNDPEQRQFIFASLTDKSMSNRETALKLAKTFVLTDTELRLVEDLLKLKTGSLRQSAIQLLLQQPGELLEPVVARLLGSKSELQRLAALETITELQSLPERQEQYDRLTVMAESLPHPTAKEKTLLAKLGQAAEYTSANGYGLCDPNLVEDWLKIAPATEHLDQASQVFTLEKEQIIAFLQGLNDLIHEHREHEYEVEYYSNYKETLLLGDKLQPLYYSNRAGEDENGAKELERYPLTEQWQEYLDQSGMDNLAVMQLVLYTQSERLDQSLRQLYRYFSHAMDYNQLEKHQLLEGWRGEFIRSFYPAEQMIEIRDWYDRLPYNQQIDSLLVAYLEDSRKEEVFDTAYLVLNRLMQIFPADRLQSDGGTLMLLAEPWVSFLRSRSYNEDSARRRFHTLYNFQPLDIHSISYAHLGPEDYVRMYDMGIIQENEVYKQMLVDYQARDFMRLITSSNSQYNLVNRFPSIRPLAEQAITRILDIELQRGELPTEVTPLAMAIQRIDGMKYFLSILSNLQKETFIRGYIYSYGSSTKKETFSHLLKNNYPLEGENEQTLAEMLNTYPISEKRLLEAAMYAPQWIEIIAAHLNWQGLRSAAWYFHAHINETFSAEKETIVAHYSPITPQEFNDGAFDLNWFQQAYHELGAERFKLLYDTAKYISAGANHRRSQLFADAVLGKLHLEQTRENVAAKRNKDQLLSYTLIPLSSEQRDQDIRARYEFIQQFLKESKSFGAQRRASEAAASAIALDNLARNAGYADVTRLTWDMEARKVDELLVYFEPYEIENELYVQLEIDTEGKTSLTAVKSGKPLKSVPSRLNKNEYIIKLKELKTELTDQYRRARSELERSMVNQTAFTAVEVQRLQQNPVLSPLFRFLVFRSGHQLGYINKEASMLLQPQAAGETSAESAGNGPAAHDTGSAPTGVIDYVQHPLQPEDEVFIAHPLHLYESGQWSLFQRDLIEHQFYAEQRERPDQRSREPFKQVFRELYLLNEDEKANGTVSRRYAGHQVQPNKTVALLRGRGWTVSYEEGLQKVDYRNNLIASVYAMADWFSPADTEAPTLETVQFHDRTTYKPVPLEQVPPVLFSEVMRDMDLAVSVAHVGGVDPEASLSTIEMRRAIVEESLRLMNITNVKIESNHARIEGSLGVYSVHLGSAMVYKQTAGALNIIPVHSQHRGRIFLPFMDEDPRTAEILSKIVMLAQDTKIKDPLILNQLKQ